MQEGSAAVNSDLQAVLSVLTSQPIVCSNARYCACCENATSCPGRQPFTWFAQVMKCSANAAGELVDQIGVEHVAAAVQQQLQIELAPQLINLSQPFTALGESLAALHMTLPDGSKPSIQVHLTANGSQQ